MTSSLIAAATAAFGTGLTAVLAANGLAALASCVLQFGGMFPARRAEVQGLSARRAVGEMPQSPRPAPFVSVHVPTYDEPPELVIATLHSLAATTAADFEVIIVDNNTADPTTWQPVALAAAALGRRFRFFHFDRVVGAKAGALNLALDLTDPRTTHVAVVDADYQVSAGFVADALAAFADRGVDYVQFPQAYRHVAAVARGVERELGDYFACFRGRAARPGAMLPTGTLSMFTVEALRRVGGWSAVTITEDAELGVRLQAVGCKGLWLVDERGTGLLPLDFAGLAKQRARWVAGNVQVLMAALRHCGATAPRLPLLALVVQLTAWVSFWLLPAAALALLAVVPGVADAALARQLAAGTIVGSAILTAARMFFVMPTPRHELGAWGAAIATRLALTWTAGTAWLPALTGRDLPFQRTAKQLGDVTGARAGARADGSFVSAVVFVCVAVAYAVWGEPVTAAACVLLAAIWPCSLLVDANLRRSAHDNPELVGVACAA